MRSSAASWAARQLRNVIERSLLKAENDRELEIGDTADDFEEKPAAAAVNSIGAPFDLRGAEASRIIEALIKHNGNKAGTARYLGMSRGTLYNRLRELEAEGVKL